MSRTATSSSPRASGPAVRASTRSARWAPWIDTDLDAYNLADTKIKGHLTHDGETKTWQDSSTNQMIWDFGEIIEYISGSITLLPGDIISTGSPAGTKRMVPGDTITIEVEGLGQLTNTVAEA